MRLELQATPREVMRAVEALQQLCVQHEVPGKILFGLALALEECGTNIVNYALEGDARRTFRVAIELAASSIVIELRDCGPEFDPTQTLLAVRKEGGDDQQIGGWGIRLARSFTDEMSYRRESGENVLRLTKRTGLTEQSIQLTTKAQGGDDSMKLDIQVQENIGGRQPGVITVRLSGSLDTATAPELERELAKVFAGRVGNLVFDLAQLKFISSAGLRVISMARKKLQEKGGTVSLVNMQPQIREVFDIVKALPGMNIFKDLAEFDEYIAARQRMHGEGV